MCVCVLVHVHGIFIMRTLCVSPENILRVNALRYFEVDGHKIQRNSPVVIGLETTVLRVSQKFLTVYRTSIGMVISIEFTFKHFSFHFVRMK